MPGQSHSVSHSVEKFRAYLPSPPMAQRETLNPTKGLEIHSAGLRVRGGRIHRAFEEGSCIHLCSALQHCKLTCYVEHPVEIDPHVNTGFQCSRGAGETVELAENLSPGLGLGYDAHIVVANHGGSIAAKCMSLISSDDDDDMMWEDIPWSYRYSQTSTPHQGERHAILNFVFL